MRIWNTWKDTADKSDNQGEHLLHGIEEEDFWAMRKLNEVNAVVGGIVGIQHQSEKLLNFQYCAEQV